MPVPEATSAEKTQQFANEISEHRPEYGKKTQDGYRALRDLLGREALCTAGPMARAELALDSPAAATLPGWTEIEARARIGSGYKSLKRRFPNRIWQVLRLIDR